MAKAPKKATGKALVRWDEELANLAKESAKGAKVGEGKFISFKSGRMSFAGADVEDNELRCVILGWTYGYAYYDPEVTFDPANPQTPICYAFGRDEDEMQPHEEAPAPQADGCAGCPFNEFGSAERGKGKACKNTVRLALIAESDLEDLDTAEVVYASIPPMSMKNWSKYVKDLESKSKRPHWSVITLMKCIPDSQSQFRVLFSCEEMIEDADMFAPLKEAWTTAQDDIGFPYPKREAKPAPAKKNAKFAKKRK